jgi:predicted dehydrogenase
MLKAKGGTTSGGPQGEGTGMLKKLGFIGAGKQAREHARAAVHLGAEIVAFSAQSLTSTNACDFMRVAPKALFALDWEDVVSHDIDALIVAVPWDVTPGMFQDFLNCPLPMLIEKPVLLGRQTEIITDPYGNKIIGFNRRFYDTVNLLKAQVEGGFKNATVTISEHIGAIAGRHSEKIIPHLWETHCSHILDTMLYVFGPLKIKAVFRHTEPDFTSVTAILTTSLGSPVTLNVNNDDPSPVGIRARFEKGKTWVLSPIEQLSALKGVEVIPADAESPIRRYVGREASTYFERGQFKPGVCEQMEAFLGGHTKDAATMNDALALQNLIDDLKS